MNFEKLKLVDVKYDGEHMISIQEDFGQEDDPSLSVAGVWNPTEKSRAYARLFAAAPELLACLIDLSEGYSMGGAKRAKEAIAKALGE